MGDSIVQRPEVFFSDLIRTVQRAKTRVYVQAMIFESGEVIDNLARALISAAKRGVEVKLIYDWVSYRYMQNELHLLPKLDYIKQLYKKKYHQKTDALVVELREAGVKVNVINNPVLLEYVFPIMNRNHSKLYIVDDSCGWIGGVNLFDIALTFADCMVKVFSPRLIEGLSDYFLSIWKRTFRDEYTLSCGDLYKLYFDSGKQGKSLIYRAGLDMIERAEKRIVFVSQFVPNGPLLQYLFRKAGDGLPITVITSHVEDKMFVGFPYRYFYEYFKRKMLGFQTIQFLHFDEKLHAKILIIDDKEVLIGSHNLAFSGVLFGTQEVSLWSKDMSLVDQLIEFVDRLIQMT